MSQSTAKPAERRRIVCYQITAHGHDTITWNNKHALVELQLGVSVFPDPSNFDNQAMANDNQYAKCKAICRIFEQRGRYYELGDYSGNVE